MKGPTIMGKRGRRQAFAPRVNILERRRLLAISAQWLGQDGGDFVGTEGTLVHQTPNDYQDVRFRLSGLTGAEIARVEVERYGGGAWSWIPNGPKNAMFLPSTDKKSGDLYIEPYFADPAGTLFQAIRVVYTDGTSEQTQVVSTAAVNPNLRAPGKEITTTFLGQTGDDWTGPTVAVGPDGVQDVRLALSNLSAGASAYVRITAATTPPRTWETGVNPGGRWNAELLNRPGASATLGTTADVYFSSDVDLLGVPLTVEVFYDHWNPDYRSYTNRSGKTDVVTIIAGAVDPSRAAMVVSETDLATIQATSLPQSAAPSGYSHVAIDAASLAGLGTPQSFGMVRSAVLSNSRGSTWIYVRSGEPTPYTGFVHPGIMRYDPTTGVFSFPPVRDEAGSALSIRLTFDDGSEAVARFGGAFSDLSRLAVDPRVGAAIRTVSTTEQLLDAIASAAPVVHLSAGVYTVSQPIDLYHPIRLTASPGAVLEFVLSREPGSRWSQASGAIQIRSSHVALDGFGIRFKGTTADWNTWSRSVIQAGLGTKDVGLSFTNLNIVAPGPAVPGVYEQAVALMNFEDGDTGRIADNVFKGGWIHLGAAPWVVTGNDYQGALPGTISPTFLNAHRSFDLTIRGNQARLVQPAGITQRFLVMGNSDSGQGIGNVIEGNVIGGGIGTPTSNVPAGYDNNPEIILTETYQPRFEGVPAAISPDGYIVQVPHLRGPISRAGDVISILTGPHAGEWRMIAQALGPTRYLLTDPLPAGDYAIAIGRGYVDQVYRGNTIDVRGMSPINAAVVISGNHWGQVIEGNAFLGGLGLRIAAGSNEGAFEGRHPAPWGWSLLPVFGLSITNNTFTDAFVSISVAHNNWASKSSAGRTYLTADFSANTIVWTQTNRPAVEIGVGGNPAYTRAAFPWLTPEELFLHARDNVGGDPVTGRPATMRIFAAVLNGEAVDDLLTTFPAWRPLTAVSHGQNGRDLVGAAPRSGPDGLQDVHLVLGGLPLSKTVAAVTIVGVGDEWRYGDASWNGSLASLIRRGEWADLYIQPLRDEAGRSLTIVIHYTDGTSTQVETTGLYATGRLPMPTRVGVDSGSSSANGTFQADAPSMGGMTYSTSHPIDVSGVADPAPEAVYQTERYGEFTYVISDLIPGGSYLVRLHFAENYWSEAGRRTFDVVLDGVIVLHQFDIFAEAGGKHRAIVREFAATADAVGRIVVGFHANGQPDYPKVDAIEVVVPRFDLARGKPTRSSSDEGPGYLPASAVDGDPATRWSSGQWMLNDETAWLSIDLEDVFDIDRIDLTWEIAFAVDYTIETSLDGRVWSTARSVVGATGGGVDPQTDLRARGRYVRIAMTRYNGTKNYSLFEVNVYSV